ncbi:MAG: sulfotransferase [Deltaproteobacteria bacterium]|nr:sulfotransferase [Deltaproteobacteria bacterium]
MPVGRVQHIEDWDCPRLPLPARLFNTLPDPLAARLLPLDEASLLKSACRRTGLRDFGDEGFREPMRMILDDLEADDHLSPLGRLTARSIFSQLLTGRLAVEDRLKRKPAIHSLEVPAPIVIVGLPRTGTTHLHNLLSRASSLRFLPMWESVNPLPVPGRRLPLPDLRRQSNAMRVRMIDYLMPLFRMMHEIDVDLPHEELQLSAMNFRSFFFEGSFRLPTYRPWYISSEHSEGYRYLRRVLQVLQDARGHGRWVLKSPQHLDQFGALTSAFPDARIVRTHRDPVRAVLSLVTMVTYAQRICFRNLDFVAEARSWVDRLEQMLRDSLEQADRLPPGQVLDIRFDEFVKDPMQTVERVLAFAAVDLDEPSREAIHVHLASHTRDRHGRVAYEFEDLGLDPEELHERFRFYRERFDLCADS